MPDVFLPCLNKDDDDDDDDDDVMPFLNKRYMKGVPFLPKWYI